MTAVITMISAPDHRCLTEAVCKQTFAQVGLPSTVTPRWLASDEACSLALPAKSNTDGMALQEAITTALERLPIDVHLTTTNEETATGTTTAKKKLLIADMESTIIREELIDELAARTGLGNEIASITAQAMRGELDFAAALQSRVAQFKGLDAECLDDLYDTCVTLMPGAETLIKTMNANGATTALVSGGFTLFTARIAQRLGFANHYGNTLEIVEGKITGRVPPPILDRAAKAATLKELASVQSLKVHDTIAVGDGANDLDMLKAAGLGVAFRGKPVVADAADIAVQHGDLTSLLYVQGYHRDEFVST